jgi:hypothetical protein
MASGPPWYNLRWSTPSNTRAPSAGVQLADGFASTIPWPCSSKEPLRVEAICKHPYPPDRTFPTADNWVGSVNAQLQFEKVGWVPAYHCAFPEYSGTTIQTEHVIRDMSPITTAIYATNHGRYARVVDGQPMECDEWITEIGCDPHEFGVTDVAAALNLKAKTTARFFCFYLQKGISKLTLYASGAGDSRLGSCRITFSSTGSVTTPIRSTIRPTRHQHCASPSGSLMQ